ncbi:GNAT family N-acetyltransferase [Nocardioides sp. LHG3406-4]|uniref:GNAT family N-acetyltransferase n=1 Tax=Nocardioides sp. LHG3406-4 TaxID=2804575 RepID=UPI003CE6E4E6
MELREITADDADGVAELVRITNAARLVDAPFEPEATPYSMEMGIRHGWDGEPGLHLLAVTADGPVGFVLVNTTEYDNPDLAWLGLLVDPAVRRHGHGSAILEAVLDVCREMDRLNVTAEGWYDDGVHAFATAHGFRRVMVSARRRQDLAALPDGLAEELYAEALPHAGDYELMRIHGRTPDDLIERLATATAAINDAPLDDLDVEDDEFPPERIRAYEEAQLARGPGFYRIVALHRDSGEVAGHTVVAVDPEQPTHGEQHDTSVVTAHRGHRLGQLLKADMVRWLREVEPQLGHVDTWNAASNGHMIGVNERLGYRLLAQGSLYQRRLED